MKIECKGREYTVVSEADYTNRLLPKPYVNYHEAGDGDEYDFEMVADALDEQDQECKVYWIFTDIKGKETELEDLDYVNNVDRAQS